MKGGIDALPAGGLSRNRLRRVVDYIHEHLQNDLSLHELAALISQNITSPLRTRRAEGYCAGTQQSGAAMEVTPK